MQIVELPEIQIERKPFSTKILADLGRLYYYSLVSDSLYAMPADGLWSKVINIELSTVMQN